MSNGYGENRTSQQEVERQLDERLMELQSLFEMSKVLNSSLNLKQINNNLLLTPMGKMMISKGMMLISSEDDVMTVETVKGMPRELIGKSIEIDNPPDNPALLDEIDEEQNPWVQFFKEFKINLLLPIISSKRTSGIICFGPKITGSPYTSSEIEFLGSLSNIAATAVENGIIFKELNQVNRELDKKIQELNTLFDIGKELNSSLDKEKIVNLLSYAIMGELVVNRCMVFLRENDTMHLVSDKGSKAANIRLDDKTHSEFFKKLCVLRDAFMIDDCKEKDIKKVFVDLGIKMISPMSAGEETKGMVAVGEKITKVPFNSHDMDFLGAAGNYAMISLENARLFEEALEKQRMEEELAIAKEIQTGLLPDKKPEIEGFDVAGVNISSREVGGDYFDWIRFDDLHYGIAIADVSGKGTPAALLMSNMQAALRALAVAHGNISEMVGRINNLIHLNTDYSKFITFFYGELDVKDKTFTFTNAGHNPPYLIHTDGSMEALTEGGLLIGMMKDATYGEKKISLRSGDCILMFTDGVSEAMNEVEEEFGEDRIELLLAENHHLDSDALIQKVINEVKLFVKDCPQSDDITMVALKVL